MVQEEKLEKILQKAIESISFRENFVYHPLLADRILDYSLKKLENGSFYKTDLFETVKEIRNSLQIKYPSLCQKYSERIANARIRITAGWNNNGMIN